jgi:hypothetical protein
VTVNTSTGSTVVHVMVTPSGTGNNLGGTGAGTGGGTAGGTTSVTTGNDTPPIDNGQDDVTAPIDSACAFPENGNKPDKDLPVTPKNSPLPATVPADCRAAVEFNNLKVAAFQLTATPAQGSRAVTLEVDVATYTAADRMSLRAVLADGSERLIFDTCRLRTWTDADPTNGNTRPPETTIRDFRPKLPQGTKTLKFDFTGATTPTYMRVRGLCDFSRTPQFYSGAPKGNFSVRPID